MFSYTKPRLKGMECAGYYVSNTEAVKFCDARLFEVDDDEFRAEETCEENEVESFIICGSAA